MKKSQRVARRLDAKAVNEDGKLRNALIRAHVHAIRILDDDGLSYDEVMVDYYRNELRKHIKAHEGLLIRAAELAVADPNWWRIATRCTVEEALRRIQQASGVDIQWKPKAMCALL